MFKYIDRHSQDPLLDHGAEINNLVLFARAAKLDDVMVFSLEENLNTGHLTPAQQSAYIDMMKDVREALSKEGVTFSVNPWATILHRDDGAALQPGQNFRLMVDVDGRQARAVVCPTDEAWRAYITEAFRRYAELKPAYIWIEDDFRFHNHFPLHWGGCFCDAHMKYFSEKAGKSLTREEFIRGVLKPGEPHPYRKIWLDSCRETTLENARLIERAVHEVSPETKVSLMSSAPQVHCAEGRDWTALLGILGGAHRIHLPAYAERRPADYLCDFNRVSMLVRAMTPDDCEVLPEVENAPWSVYTKSKAFTAFQLFSTLAMNVQGATLNLFDMIGTGAQLQDGYQDMLGALKPYLSALNATGAFRAPRKGVRVIYDTRSSRTIHTSEGREMTELYPDESWWAAALCAAGIPFAYHEGIDLAGEVAAVSGQVLRNYTEGQIRALFDRNKVLLNAAAVQTLCDMGLGGLIGAAGCRVLDSEYGECAYERSLTPVFGKQESRASTLGRVLKVDYETEPAPVTDLRDARRALVGPGMAVAGGRAVIFPHLDPPLRVILSVRAEWLRRTVGALRPDAPIVADAPLLEPYAFDDGEGGYYLYLLNGSMDGYDGATIITPAVPAGVDVFTREGVWAGAVWSETERGARVTADMPPMTGTLLRIKAR